MEDFRAKPVTVPEDWFEQMVKLKKKAGTAADEKKSAYIKDDAIVFFETALSVPEVTAAIEKQVRFYEKEPYGTPLQEWGKVRGAFLRWWILSRLKVNREDARLAKINYTLGTVRAFEEYFLTSDMQKAYTCLHQDLNKHGFVDGGEN